MTSEPGSDARAGLAGPAVVAVAIALLAALVAALAATASATARHGYWSDGYYRLLADAVRVRFDPWGAGAAAGALVVVALLHRLGRRRALPRALVRAAAVALAVVVLARVAVAVDAWRAARGPNVLLISIDTLRADRLGAYGATLPTSPTIDRRLAAEGVLFERCFSQSPKTTPSHMTLMTSLYPPVHGIDLWQGDAPGAVLNPRVRTLADVLKNAGYATAAFTGGVHVHRSRGFGQGFDVYRHGHELERALAWLGKHRRSRFFVFFHTYQVHDPYVPPEPLVQRFAPGTDGRIRDTLAKLRTGMQRGWDAAHRVFWEAIDPSSPHDVETAARLYDAGIRHMDETTIAPLLDRLDALHLARDTLVVFLSDHGEEFMEHGIFLHDDLHAETLHVPLLMRLPGRLPGGARRSEPVRLVDVMPTILDLVGARAPAYVQGRSLVPLLRGEPDPTSVDVPSDYSSTTAGTRRVYQSVRASGLSYIVDGGREQLFDTATDPGERHDVAAERSDALAGMRERWRRWGESCAPLAARFAPRGDGVAPSAETMHQLRALGYVE
jgi:arylsulfatase A-like enzyme